MPNKLILASSSPRRRELLSQVKIPYSIQKPNIDESQVNTSDPVKKVKQVATLKGQNVTIEHENEVILSSDTVVSFNQHIFEKPKDKEEASKMIASLSGDVHEVFTGVMIRSADYETVFVEGTKVEFWPMSKEEIDWYISTNDPYDKAGAYGIQSLGAMFVKQIVGDYNNVVGLPISRVVRELRNFSVYPEMEN
ncbi:Maf family protein [Tenuibacillus multivorans]|uniref:dTTP/UTP pyrophosphatase n=1 Tax=Tenuibacillus multivorans TaxID=237069 RepID=A0A1H0ETC0_9BACI|nr:Maf family protein [Tenuibacillus multivorans]GEL76963.1 septum formation protein Maf [Tenuibacillus multivorans]SDN85566.1 septum formation protein [Tenuibacillus multivorans]